MAPHWCNRTISSSALLQPGEWHSIDVEYAFLTNRTKPQPKNSYFVFFWNPSGHFWQPSAKFAFRLSILGHFLAVITQHLPWSQHPGCIDLFSMDTWPTFNLNLNIKSLTIMAPSLVQIRILYATIPVLTITPAGSALIVPRDLWCVG